MLQRLSLRNFVIVKTLDLDIEAGFTVLTGETGAGKSILLDAIGLLLGERSDAMLVGQNGDKADISGEFSLSDEVQSWLLAQDLTSDDGVLLIRRTIDKQGKSRAFINGITVTLAQLRAMPGVEVSGGYVGRTNQGASSSRSVQVRCRTSSRLILRPRRGSGACARWRLAERNWLQWLYFHL